MQKMRRRWLLQAGAVGGVGIAAAACARAKPQAAARPANASPKRGGVLIHAGGLQVTWTPLTGRSIRTPRRLRWEELSACLSGALGLRHRHLRRSVRIGPEMGAALAD